MASAHSMAPRRAAWACYETAFQGWWLARHPVFRALPRVLQREILRLASNAIVIRVPHGLVLVASPGCQTLGREPDTHEPYYHVTQRCALCHAKGLASGSADAYPVAYPLPPLEHHWFNDGSPLQPGYDGLDTRYGALCPACVPRVQLIAPRRKRIREPAPILVCL